MIILSKRIHKFLETEVDWWKAHDKDTKTYKMEETTTEDISRDTLRRLATEPIITMVLNQIKANALIGNLMCGYTIPDTHLQLTVDTLIKLLKPKLTDVTIMHTGPRSIQIDWS